MRPLPRPLILLAGLGVAACGRSPATTFLAITPIPPVARPATYGGAPVRVPFLHVPVTLDRPEFAREVAGTVAVSDFDRWAAPLGLLARDALIGDLQARLPAGKVLPPDAAPAVPELRVEATVTRFVVVGGEAVMDASFRLIPPTSTRTRTPAPRSPVPVSLRVPLAADTPVAQAQAWSALIAQLADRIARDIAMDQALGQV